MSAADTGFAEFYLASYGRLAAQLSAYLGDPAEAEDVVQEAFLRAWQRWKRVGAYEEPVAWVRRVAWNRADQQTKAASSSSSGSINSIGRLVREQAIEQPDR